METCPYTAPQNQRFSGQRRAMAEDLTIQLMADSSLAR